MQHVSSTKSSKTTCVLVQNVHTHHKCLLVTFLLKTTTTTKKRRNQSSPGTSGHLHTGVKGGLALKVIHDDAVVTVDDMLVDALPTEMLEDFVDAVDTVQNGLEEEEEY